MVGENIENSHAVKGKDYFRFTAWHLDAEE